MGVPYSVWLSTTKIEHVDVIMCLITNSLWLTDTWQHVKHFCQPLLDKVLLLYKKCHQRWWVKTLDWSCKEEVSLSPKCQTQQNYIILQLNILGVKVMHSHHLKGTLWFLLTCSSVDKLYMRFPACTIHMPPLPMVSHRSTDQQVAESTNTANNSANVIRKEIHSTHFFRP